MANCELVLNGFDGGTDATDDLVLWVSAVYRSVIEKFIADNNLQDKVTISGDLPDEYTSDNGIDFKLPEQEDELKARIQALLNVAFDNRQAVQEGWDLFEVGGRLLLQRIDDPSDINVDAINPLFPSDADALIFVSMQAFHGSKYHRDALERIGTLAS